MHGPPRKKSLILGNQKSGLLKIFGLLPERLPEPERHTIDLTELQGSRRLQCRCRNGIEFDCAWACRRCLQHAERHRNQQLSAPQNGGFVIEHRPEADLYITST